MQTTETGLVTQIYRFLSSKKLALYSFIALIVVLLPKSLIREKIVLLDWSIKIILVLLFANILACTIRRFKTLSKPVLIIHVGCLVTMAGALAGSAGFVATVNIHEGSSTGTFYRWDIEQDGPLGFDLAVNRINAEYYPVGIKVGVLKNGGKHNLFLLRTGESFKLEGYRVQAGDINFGNRSLFLDIYDADDTRLGSSDTLGNTTMPPDFPYSFMLVAFRDPVQKRAWTEMSLLQDGKVVAEGTAEVNHPFQWNGLRFFNTQLDRDPSGRPYAGIQIVKDPGIPYVYAGISLICLGAFWCMMRLFAGIR